MGRPALLQGQCFLALPRHAVSVSCSCASLSCYDVVISTCAGPRATVTALPAGLAQSCSRDSLRHGRVQVCLRASNWSRQRAGELTYPISCLLGLHLLPIARWDRLILPPARNC